MIPSFRSYSNQYFTARFLVGVFLLCLPAISRGETMRELARLDLHFGTAVTEADA